MFSGLSEFSDIFLNYLGKFLLSKKNAEKRKYSRLNYAEAKMKYREEEQKDPILKKYIGKITYPD